VERLKFNFAIEIGFSGKFGDFENSEIGVANRYN